MKRSKFLEVLGSFVLAGGGMALSGFAGDGKGGDCDEWEVFFIKVPKSYGEDNANNLIEELNEKFKDERKRFVVISADNRAEIKLVAAKHVDGRDVEGLILEIRKEFF